MDGLIGLNSGLTCLYGPTDITAELSKRRQEATRQRLALTTIEIKVDVGDAKPHKLSLPEISEHRVIHLRRIKEEVRDHLVGDYWKQFRDSIGSTEPFDTLAARPDFVAFLHEQEEFRHLDLIEYAIREPTGVRQVATLFSDRHVIGVEAVGLPRAKLALPDAIREALKANNAA
jgi:hypothetical protein